MRSYESLIHYVSLFLKKKSEIILPRGLSIINKTFQILASDITFSFEISYILQKSEWFNVCQQKPGSVGLVELWSKLCFDADRKRVGLADYLYF